MEKFLHDLSWVLPLRSDTATDIAHAFSWFGYTPFFIAALPLIYWLLDKHAATRVALVVIFTGVVNGLLKDVFDDPRPDASFALDPQVGQSYGLPSGHAQVAFAMWLWIAYELKRAWFWPIAIVIALGVSLSRLYLGVHDVEDVLVGAGLGIASLFVLRWFFSPAFDFWRASPAALQLGVIVAVSAALYVFWPEPGGPGTKFAAAGMLFGWWAGVLLDERGIRFRRHENWIIAVVAAAIGVAALFLGVMRTAPALIALGVEPIWAATAQGALIGLFVTAIAPRLFQIAGAARREPG